VKRLIELVRAEARFVDGAIHREALRAAFPELDDLPDCGDYVEDIRECMRRIDALNRAPIDFSEVPF
jgi:hypothetical protein